MIQYLNGVYQDGEMGKIKNPLKGKGKALVTKVKNGRVFAKVAAAPMRLAFLTILRANGLGLAVKVFQALKKNPKAIEKFWMKFGGSMVELQKAVKAGVDFHNKLHPKKKVSGLGVAVEAAAATAAPIVVSVLAVLKQIIPLAQTVLPEKEQAILDQGINEFKANISEIAEQAEGLPTSEETSNKNKLSYFWDKYKKPILWTGGLLLATGITVAIVKKVRK